MTRWSAKAALALLVMLAGVAPLSWAQSARQNPLRSEATRSVGFVPKHERVAATRTHKPRATTKRRITTTEQVEPVTRPIATRTRRVRRSTRSMPAAEMSVYNEVQQDIGLPIESYEVGGPGVVGGCSDCGGGGGCASCAGPPAACGGCGSCSACLIPCPIISLNNLEVVGGVHGFTGPLNRGQTGSFGFHYGVNYGAPLHCFPISGLGFQVGTSVVQSNLSGAEFTRDDRSQVFVTGGLFRRVDWGFQGGLVVDYLSDNWYRQTDLVQLRGELSWVHHGQHELGFWFNTATQSNDGISELITLGGQRTLIQEMYEATDLYAFFYRRRLDWCGAEARGFFGFSGESDGLIGSDLRIPLTDALALQGGFTYLIPETSKQSGAHRDESWNLAINLVWYPGLRSARSHDYYRPLFNVADNGSFLVDQR